MVNDIFSTLRTFLSKVSDGEKSASEVKTAVNHWLRESGDALKVKIEDEVEQAVAKMGFVKRAEFEELREEVARLKALPAKVSVKKAAVKKRAPKKDAVKKTAVKKASK